MKVAIGFRIMDGPWGGGNRFARALRDALQARGDQVTHDLSAPDIDIVLLTDPRWRNPSAAFTAGPVLRYLMFRNPRTMVIHRVNECDERKGTTGMNEALARANYCADFTVFVGSWLAELPVWRRSLHTPWRTILNGANAALFSREGFVPWSGSGPLRLVTHHWGPNRMKGFDVYERIDAMLAEPRWAGRIAFTYVGNLPPDVRFRHARHVAPLDGPALADELRSHHAYVTASICEPGPNHQNEGALCGLPLLYRNSGGLPEYCDGYGVPFDGPPDFETALDSYAAAYRKLVSLVEAYPHTEAASMAKWLSLLDELRAGRDTILARRNLWRAPWMLLRNQVPL